MINNLKTMLQVDPEDKQADRTLHMLLDLCRDDIRSYCNIQEVDRSLDSVLCLMVCERYNRIGAEGLASRGASGISEAYLTDYSEAVYKRLRPRRRPRSVQ